MNMEYVWLAVIVGWVLHQVGDLAEISMQVGKPANALAHFKRHPWRMALSGIGVFAGLIVFYPSLQNQVGAGLNQEALTLAMGIGYAGDSMAGKLANMFSSAMNRNAG